MKTDRKRMRLQEYDYSCEGAYFLTICTEDKRHVLCRIVGDGVLDVPKPELTAIGRIVQARLAEMDRIYHDISIEKAVIMPNHIHLLLTVRKLEAERGTSRTPSPTGSAVNIRANARIPQFVSTLKRYTNRECGFSIWQRAYHDHIIRDDADYLRCWNYIDTNPARWAEDRYYCE